jgi:biopolymer transport protein ExbB/TolQ
MIFTPGIFAAAQGGADLSYIWDKATPEAKVIIVILCGFSIVAWSLMLQKSFQMRRAKRYNSFFEAEFRQQKTVLGIFERNLPVEGCPLFAVYTDGCTDLEARLKLPDGTRRSKLSLKSVEHVKRQLEGSVAREALRLESGLILLAIAVSGAPFMGLLGTVWGVMDTFGGIAKAGRADLAAMAPGVAAALVTTVAGLLVAIPSMFGYNYLVHSLRILTVELDNFAQTLASRMETEFLPDDE